MNPAMDAIPPARAGRPRNAYVRALGRLAAALLCVIVPFALVAIPFNLFAVNPLIRKLGAVLLAGAVLGGYGAYVRVVEHRGARELGLTRVDVSLLLQGMLLGSALLCSTLGLLWSVGAYEVIGHGSWHDPLLAIPGFLLGAVLEEVVIRGILFRIAEQAVGTWIALVVSAVVFGALHLHNPGATWFSAIAIAMEAGVMLAAAFVLTRSLWFCIGIHFAWNYLQGGIFSISVSGGAAKGWLTGRMTGSDWLTGGAFGVEASLVAWAVCTLAGFGLLAAASARRRTVAPHWRRAGAPLAGDDPRRDQAPSTFVPRRS
jgi:membrane protease YdiL (CAAX protease family)